MKATGIIRRLDDLGRIVIPREILHTAKLHDGDPMELYIGDDGSIIFKKYNPDEPVMATLRELEDEILNGERLSPEQEEVSKLLASVREVYDILRRRAD